MMPNVEIVQIDTDFVRQDGKAGGAGAQFTLTCLIMISRSILVRVAHVQVVTFERNFSAMRPFNHTNLYHLPNS